MIHERLDLGWLLGHRFLLLTHRGRRTELLHQTVLEVLRYDPATEESVVLAALGDRADWLRNIRNSPPLEVQTDHGRYVPAYRVLPDDETVRFLGAWQREHPIEAAVGMRVLRIDAGQWSRVTLVSFRPREGPDGAKRTGSIESIDPAPER